MITGRDFGNVWGKTLPAGATESCRCTRVGPSMDAKLFGSCVLRNPYLPFPGAADLECVEGEVEGFTSHLPKIRVPPL